MKKSIVFAIGLLLSNMMYSMDVLGRAKKHSKKIVMVSSVAALALYRSCASDSVKAVVEGARDTVVSAFVKCASGQHKTNEEKAILVIAAVYGTYQLYRFATSKKIKKMYNWVIFRKDK